LAAVPVALLLAGCEAEVQPGDLQLITGFAGLVAADEPNAVVVGREVLANNGTAVDAAVAMAFTLSATLPSRAGVGSGGACIVYDHGQQAAQALSFTPQAAPGGGVVPLMSRAMAVMHARYGFVRWELLVTPGENLARFGNPVSRALAKDLEAARSKILGNPGLRKIYAGGSGGVLQEGDNLVQPELSTVLSGIRQRGGGYLYSADLPDRLSLAAERVGVSMSPTEIRESVPSLVEPLRVEVGPDFLFLPPPPSTGGVMTGQLWQLLAELEDWEPDARDSGVLLAQAERAVLADRSKWLLPDGVSKGAPQDLVSGDRAEALDLSNATVPASAGFAATGAGFAVGDRFGNAVACSFTMNAIFGSGRVLADTGIVLASPPAPGALDAVPLSVAVIGNENIGRARLAASAGSGDSSPSDLVQVLIRVLNEDEPPVDAVAAPRVHLIAGGSVGYELGLSGDVISALEESGFQVRAEADPTRINLFFCPEGYARVERAALCGIATDPRGHGLAETVR
jgi:gamma-glutamyltranspeptidase/glutathione hydrolase